MLSNRLHCGILLLVYYYLTGAQISVQPAIIDPKVSESAYGEVCTPETNPSQRSQLENEVEQVLNGSILEQFYGLYRHFPASSCADIYQGHPSGYYWLNGANEPQLVYCSVNENRCCDENGCVLPTSTCLIQVHNAQMVGERYSHQFAHVEGNLILASTQSTTPPMEFLIPGCVVESLHINLELQKDSTDKCKRLMLHMLMEFQLHMVTQDNTFGHLLQ